MTKPINPTISGDSGFKNVREFFDKYIYVDTNGRMNERHMKFCKVEDKCMIIPATIKFITAANFLDSVVKIGKENNLYYTMSRIGTERPIENTKIYVLLYRDEKWNAVAYDNVESLLENIVKELTSGNRKFLIPYISLEPEIADKMSRIRNSEEPITQWPLIDVYDFAAEEYKIISVEAFLTRFTYHLSGRFIEAPVFVNLDYENRNSIITPAELYTLDDNCAPCLLSEYLARKNMEYDPKSVNKCDKPAQVNSEITDFEEVWNCCNKNNAMFEIIPDFDTLKNAFGFLGLSPVKFDEGLKALFIEICSKLKENGYMISKS